MTEATSRRGSLLAAAGLGAVGLATAACSGPKDTDLREPRRSHWPRRPTRSLTSNT